MRKCIVHYFDINGETRWKCPNSLMSSSNTHSMNLEHCYLSKCPGRKPNYRVCDWKDCNQPIAPNKLRHCSEKCRKKDNMYAYKLREKEKKNTAIVQVEEKSNEICSWKDCKDKVAPNRQKHCSEKCRKKDNSHAYRQRQKMKKMNA